MQSTDKKMNYFNYLPPEMIVTIFKKLNLTDLINLKEVDKRFKEIIEQIKIKEIRVYANLSNTITNSKYNSKLQLWFYTNDLTYFDKENIIDYYQFPYFRTKLQLDKNLKRLSIYINGYAFDLSNLNEFKLLEHLSIVVEDCDGDYELNLENLIIFEIYNEHGCADLKLTLYTNKLFAFKSFKMEFDNFIFKYPYNILFYETDNQNYDKISIFNNLQYLKLTNLFGAIDRDILSKFKKLKTLDLEADYFGKEITFNNLKNDINFLINQKENLKRSELQIYFNGVKLIDQNKINQLKWSYFFKSIYNVFEFQIKNYDLLKDNCCTYVERINYCNLIKLIQIIPSSFINKFPFIQQIYAIDRIDNEDQFIKFLNDLPYLIELKLIHCELTKSFYKKLINLVYLNELKYLTIDEKEDLKIKFNFIVNLKRLRMFITNQKINNIDSVRKLYKINDDIKKFGFKINSKNYIRIIENRGTFRIDSYYLDHNLKKVENPSIDNLALKDLLLKLKNLKFEL